MESWIASNISFYLITLTVLVSAFLAAFSRNIVRAAYSLFFTLFGMAGYYVLLGSSFLAVTQVIIYVGGILVLLMFGVLLTNRPLEKISSASFNQYFWPSFVGAMLLAGALSHIIWSTDWPLASALGEPVSSLRDLGSALLEEYSLAFELAGMTLLLCLVGAAYLVRREER